jgi:Tol biopolymer transport system component
VFVRGGQIHFMNADGGAQRRAGLPGYPVWSRDGRWLATFSKRDGRLYTARRDGSGRRQIHRVRHRFDRCVFPDWSYDARMLAYSAGCEADMTFTFIVNRDGSKKRRVLPRGWTTGPKWAPRGNTLLVLSNWPRTQPPAVFIVNALTGKSTRIRGFSFDWCGCVWSRDGSRIFALTERGGPNDGPELLVIPARGGRLRKLSPDDLKVLDFTLSPDGQMVAMHGAVGSRDLEIYVMRTDGTGLRQLTDNQRVRDSEPAWSPDSRKLAFMSDRDGNREIYVMNADGSDQTNVSRNPAHDEAPSWVPPLRR